MPASRSAASCPAQHPLPAASLPHGSGRPPACHMPSLQMSPSARVLGNGRGQTACWLGSAHSRCSRLPGQLPPPGLTNENYQARDVMGAVTGLFKVRQRGGGGGHKRNYPPCFRSGSDPRVCRTHCWLESLPQGCPVSGGRLVSRS